ncbi:exclusion protein [Prevotella copri]|nr:exclusion protein [Segatella copri]
MYRESFNQQESRKLRYRWWNCYQRVGNPRCKGRWFSCGNHDRNC